MAAKTGIDKIAPDLYRLSTYVSVQPPVNQFLVKETKPLLYHTGMRGVPGFAIQWRGRQIGGFAG
jgi:hypothetical protein